MTAGANPTQTPEEWAAQKSFEKLVAQKLEKLRAKARHDAAQAEAQRQFDAEVTA